MSRSPTRSRAAVAAALLTLVAALGLSILSYVEHTKNIRPSSIINAYLLLTLSFDVAQLRTKWLRGQDPAESGVASATLAVKLLVLVSEAIEKRGILFARYASPSPEATSGLYSRGLFWWLNPLFRLGYRNDVTDGDLFASDGDLLSESLGIRFRRHWVNRGCSQVQLSLFTVTDRQYRQEVPPEAHAGLGCVTSNVGASWSRSVASPSGDILPLYAASPNQQDHQASEPAGV